MKSLNSSKTGPFVLRSTGPLEYPKHPELNKVSVFIGMQALPASKAQRRQQETEDIILRQEGINNTEN